MGKMISNIVFTKNRPLQLDAYLESLYRYIPSEIIQTYVLYKVELFEQQYEQLFDKYRDCVVVREKDFHRDLLNILQGISTRYTLFGIDDVVYFDCVDFDVIDQTFSEHSEDIFGFSLRFGTENVKDGGDPISETFVSGQRVYSLDWTQGRTPATRYPFELCATIYPTPLLKKVIYHTMENNLLVRKLFSPDSFFIRVLGRTKSRRKILKYFGYFFSPNTLESWNCRWSQNHSEQLPGFLYFQKLCASAIQVNMVNTSTNNVWDGTAEHTVESLNEKYKEDFRLDIDFISNNKPTEPHCGKENFKLVKKN